MLPFLKKIFTLKTLALTLVFTCAFFTGKFIAGWGLAGGQNNPETGEVSEENGGADLPDRLNVLLLGIDARKGEENSRTDSMIVVSVDRKTEKIAVVSIPRDTMVDLEGHGTCKINMANVYGGPELARKTVEDLLDTKIPYYVKTNFEGFKEIVDTLGGVEIEVEKKMYYPEEDINLKPGLQRLNGSDALGYVRYRHDALGDITRTERQQKFLTALAKEMLRPRTIIKLPKLIPQLMDVVDTNIGVGDAVFLARAASGLESDSIVTATLPGTFYNYKGISYWKADEQKAGVVISQLFEGAKVATITGPDITIPPDKPKVDPKPEQEENPIENETDLETEPVPDEDNQPGTSDGSDDEAVDDSENENDLNQPEQSTVPDDSAVPENPALPEEEEEIDGGSGDTQELPTGKPGSADKQEQLNTQDISSAGEQTQKPKVQTSVIQG